MVLHSKAQFQRQIEKEEKKKTRAYLATGREVREVRMPDPNRPTLLSSIKTGLLEQQIQFLLAISKTKKNKEI